MLCWSMVSFVLFLYHLHTCSTHVRLERSLNQQVAEAIPRRVNALVTDYDSHLRNSIHDAIATGAGPRDPRVVGIVRKLFDPPSDKMIKLARRVIKTPQTEAVIKILEHKVGYV